MKRFLCLLLVITACLSFSACHSTEGEPVTVAPQESQMKAICELATMKCYYHNVAKHFEENVEGFGPWKKDRHFWIEYSGIVTIGIDIAKLDIIVDGTDVTITLPPAEVQNCTVDESSLVGDYIIIDKKSAEVLPEHQTAACAKAEENMKMAASNNTSLLTNAQQRAQKLLEDYVNNIGEVVNIEYNIVWAYLDMDGNIIKTVNNEPQQTTENTKVSK